MAAYYLLMCRSITYAQRAAKALERYGISSIIVKGPQGMSSSGCVYCVRISERRVHDAVRIIKSTGISPVRVFMSDGNGNIREVQA